MGGGGGDNGMEREGLIDRSRRLSRFSSNPRGATFFANILFPVPFLPQPIKTKQQEAELIHSRWAMLGVAGALLPEVLGYGDWVSAQDWVVKGGNATWLGVTNPLGISTLVGIQAVLFAAAEGARGQEPDAEKRKYPGGSFDPLGWSKDAGALGELKLKELKNGRLAMVAFIGFVGQHAATGKTPLAALSEHLSNPWVNNVATNGVSIPGL